LLLFLLLKKREIKSSFCFCFCTIALETSKQLKYLPINTFSNTWIPTALSRKCAKALCFNSYIKTISRQVNWKKKIFDLFLLLKWKLKPFKDLFIAIIWNISNHDLCRFFKCHVRRLNWRNLICHNQKN
jgi:hypothetical protein